MNGGSTGLRLALLCASALIVLSGLSGCFNLDGFLYNQPLKTTKYELGAFNDPALPDVNGFMPDSALDPGALAPVAFSSGGYTLYGFWLKHPAAAATMLYCHGNYKDLDNEWTRAKLFYYHGFDVFIFDYRGLGMSEGNVGASSLPADGRAAMSYLTANGVLPSAVLVYGHSLGSIPATAVASDYHGAAAPKGLVLEAPIGSSDLFVQDATDLPLPGDTLVHDTFDNVSVIERVTIPYFWLQGDHDDLIRWDTQGQALYDHYGGATKYEVIVPGAHHADIEQTLQAHYGGTHYSVYLSLFDEFLAGAAPSL